MFQTNGLKKLFIVVSGCLILFAKPLFPAGEEKPFNQIQLDFQGDTHFSRYNFTDLKIPYDGCDGWAEMKFAYWLESSKSFGPFLSVVPVFTTANEFWWQKNMQISWGLQFYPFPLKAGFLRSVRIFALGARRAYFDKPAGVDQENTDIQIGADYYFDNIFDNQVLTTLIWSNAGYRKSNFSMKDYQAFLWTGNVKIGGKLRFNRSVLLGYAFSEWTYVPKVQGAMVGKLSPFWRRDSVLSKNRGNLILMGRIIDKIPRLCRSAEQHCLVGRIYQQPGSEKNRFPYRTGILNRRLLQKISR